MKSFYCSRYFLADLDVSKDRTDKIVCFSPEKHTVFTSAMKSSSAFEIRNAKVVPGEDRNDIKCWQDCEVLKTSRQLNFDKTYSDHVQKEENITQIQNLREYQLVKLKIS